MLKIIFWVDQNHTRSYLVSGHFHTSLFFFYFINKKKHLTKHSYYNILDLVTFSIRLHAWSYWSLCFDESQLRL